ncbi:MAG: FMN-binding protein [Clostridia bacterium]|nr:FMN-binding protein [Clostridia bacterium]
MKNYIKSVISLTVICAVVATLLAVTNFVTSPIIEKNAASAANEALVIVMPEGTDFAPVDISAYQLPATVTEVYTEASGGCVVKLTTAGYGTDMVIMCGVSAAGEITGATCLSSNETLGVEKTYGDTVAGVSADTIEGLATVSGATMTTQAYKDALKDALNTAIIIGGGSVDIRSEEEILADNLKEALPAGEGAFTQWFVTEALTDVSAVYVADNGAGYVFISGEEFIAVDSEFNVLTAVADDVKAVMSENAQAVASSEMTEVDITGYEDMPSAIEKAYKTTSGNYVFEIKASGFGIKGDHYYNPSGEYIYIKVSVTADGKVLACQTISQSETDGIGSACADASFYSQFNGKDETNYGEIDAISGATITTNGYKTGVSRAFEAVKILEGVA